MPRCIYIYICCDIQSVQATFWEEALDSSTFKSQNVTSIPVKQEREVHGKQLVPQIIKFMGQAAHKNKSEIIPVYLEHRAQQLHAHIA